MSSTKALLEVQTVADVVITNLGDRSLASYRFHKQGGLVPAEGNVGRVFLLE